MKIKSFFDKTLIKQMLFIGVPVMVQQLLLTSLGLVDSIMVGSIQYGISAVGIATQMESIMMTVGFGINTGIAIYISQFFGKNDSERIKKAFAFMVLVNALNSFIFTFLAVAFTKDFISFFNSNEDVVKLGVNYLQFAGLSYFFSSMSLVFSYVYRNIQNTKVVMYTSAISMAVNVVLNYLLIHGIGIFPKMGVAGAGFATLISALVGFLFNLLYAMKTKQIFLPHLNQIISGLKPAFFLPILKRSIPFIINEALFSIGSVLYVRFLNKGSAINPDPYEGFRIAEIVVSFVFTVVIALSSAATAILGQQLGAHQYEKAKSSGKQFMVIAFLLAIFLGGLNLLIARPLVSLFNPTTSIFNYAVDILSVFSLRIFFRVFIVLVFSTLRAGGKSRTVMFLDAGIMWIVGVPIAFIATEYWNIPSFSILYLIFQFEAFIRFVIGIIIFFRYRWIKNITSEVTG